ncbi:ubiquitin-binding serine/threonine protein kinase VPS15 [Ascoidea rubescens DSM 1968]|uniref:non-specific serine/threonine protein kinase n=1 Tax=Ascoidea rubescens DSM 1968 TaxID=1344418 RepID=A0A1D2VQF1_9ASCO|nr:ARM repeat-containing protein [Ascoidea rubescens DSM 1968]ODV63834.1 ARM repeat-containing protein [Ascoidea rubescens DSM 1968]
MGTQLSLLTPTAPTVALSSYIDVLDGIQYFDQLGRTRFLKTIKAADQNGYLIVKLLIKPDLTITIVTIISKILSNIPSAIPYTKIVETEKACYLLRPFLYSNLYDIISTRPFLEKIEKIWITFQLLSILSKIHENDITHGDIKSENIMITTWKYCLLTDFAPFKPIYLPEDNPSQFSFFFDTSHRRTCYLAPERFLSKNEIQIQNQAQAQKLNLFNKFKYKIKNNTITKEMDIFSLGCVIAELFLEGNPIFTLAQLFKYKKKQYTPNLNSIDNIHIRNLITSMISLNPKDRKSANYYLNEYKNKIFPSHFYNFLNEYMKNMSEGINLDDELKFNDRFQECDYRIEKLYNDFDKIVYFLGFDYDFNQKLFELNNKNFANERKILPIQLNLPTLKGYTLKSTSQVNLHDGSALIILSLLLSSIRNTFLASSKIKACELLLALSERVNDEAKLDRCLPYLIYLLDDPCQDVQVAALKSFTKLLEMVDSLTPVNVFLFSEYIIPNLITMLRKANPYVKMFFASSLPSLAQSASRFHDMIQLMKSNVINSSIDPETENGILTSDNVFDVSKISLSEDIEEFVVSLLTDTDPYVKIAFLQNIIPLCGFFGKEKTNDVILSHLITYLNDKNPQLRMAFVDCIEGIIIYVGPLNFEQYVLPLLVQTLTDPEEFIVIKVLQNFNKLVKLRLIRKPFIWDIAKTVSKLILHPNEWIRQATLHLIISIADSLIFAEKYCILLPLVKPFFKYHFTEFDWNTLYPAMKSPVTIAVYKLSLTWSLKAEKSLFWATDKGSLDKNSLSNNGLTFMAKSLEGMVSRLTIAGSNNGTNGNQNKKAQNEGLITDNASVPLSSDDHKWIEKLILSGFETKDLWKLATLRDYLYRVARSSTRMISENDSTFEIQDELLSLGIYPRNVFLDGIDKSEAKIPTLGLSKPILGSLLFGVKKASPSISENQENVYADLEQLTLETDFGESSSDSKIVTLKLPQTSTVAGKITHTYTGDDPNILKFLNNIKIETTLDDFPEFGAALSNIPTNDYHILKNVSNWKPKGLLVAHLLEHQGSINCVVASPDHSYFVTGGEDGYVKLWNTYRLERDVKNSSSLSANLKSAVLKIVFIEDRDCFAVSTEDGYIKIFRVGINNSRKEFTKLILIRKYKLAANEYALWLDFLINESKPLLVVNSPLSKIIGIDIRTMSEAFVWDIPLYQGYPTCFCIDNKKGWLLVGTSDGYLNFFDLRFELRIKVWRFPSGFPIRKISVLPNDFSIRRHKNRFVSIIGGTGESEITIWDISKGQCCNVYCCSTSSQPGNYFLEEIEDSEYDGGRIEKGLGRKLVRKLEADNSMTAFTSIEFHTADYMKHLYFISATKEYKIVFWNVSSPEHSKVITGLSLSEDIPRFTSSQINPGLTVVSEIKNSGTSSSAPGSKRRKSKLSRPSLISVEQLELVKNHFSCINDLTVIVSPFIMIVSVDLSGVINVFK